MDKYSIDFSKEIIKRDKTRLINQLWKLIPMKENGEDWESHLKIIKEELIGLVRLYPTSFEGLVLLCKLEGLNSEECDTNFMLYRKTIFRCIDLLTAVLANE